MSKIIISAVLAFENQADRDKAIALTRDIQQATRDEEDGCLSYCFAPDPCTPTDIQVYELWEGEEALAKHFVHHTYEAMVEALGQCNLVSSTNRMYLVAKDEPVYGANGERRSKFFTD